MPIPTLPNWFAKALLGSPGPRSEGGVAAGTDTAVAEARAKLRVGIPRVLNIWSTHRFWITFLGTLGIDTRRIEFSSDTSEDQARQYAKGRGTVDCCYPVKCISGHYGELLANRKRPIDILLSPMIQTLPSFLGSGPESALCVG